MRDFRKPKYEPITLRGTKISSHIARRAIIVPNGTAPEDRDATRMRSRVKSVDNMTLKMNMSKSRLKRNS